MAYVEKVIPTLTGEVAKRFVEAAEAAEEAARHRTESEKAANESRREFVRNILRNSNML